MKRTRWFTTAMAMVMVLAMGMTAALAEPPPLKGFAVTGTGTSSFITNAVISANAANGGPVVITSLQCSTNHSDNVVNVWVPTGVAVIASAASASVNFPVVATNGFVNGDTVVIRHRTGDTYDIRIVDTMLATTNLLLTASATTAAGDIAYQMTKAAILPLKSVQGFENASGVIRAPYPGPVALIQTGTMAAGFGILTASGYYEQP